MTTLASIASSPEVAAACPTLAEAAGDAASPALRNRATLGGNLGQVTRCGYYRMKSFECFKRGDANCPVRGRGGVQENAGIFENEPCACAHPSSLAPVLGSVGAIALVVSAKGPKDERRLPFDKLYAPPALGKHSDLALAPDEVIARIDVPPIALGVEHVGYAEIRQKAAFDWPLVTCAVWFVGGETAVKEARVWLGSVSPSPWRSEAAEKALVGKPFDASLAAAAGVAATTGATPLPGTAYKVELVKVAVRRALMSAWERRK
jgi:xanthine dehydrogenase YagS FAD-binding subunit